MAVIRRLDKRLLESVVPHTDVKATYAVVELKGQKYLQIDTYGSAARKIKGKQSQSIRFAPGAIEKLREILEREL